MAISPDKAKCRAKKGYRFEEETRICQNPRIGNLRPDIVTPKNDGQQPKVFIFVTPN